MAKYREVPCKQYASKEKNVEVLKNFMAFLRTLVIALTIYVRIMSISCCPVQIFAIIIHSKYFPVSDWLKPHA